MTRCFGDRDDRTGDRTVINEDLFRSILIAERKRADRSNQPIGLLLIEAGDAASADSASRWAAAIVAVAGAVRSVDVLGWFEAHAAIGVILTELRPSTTITARALEARIRRELARWVPQGTAETFSVQFHLYSGSTRSEDNRSCAIDLVLFPEFRSRDGRHALYTTSKRGLDIVGSLAMLILLSPLFLLIACLVKLKSPGPVFYGQVRIGRHGNTFTMLKFRTMVANADPRLHQDYVKWFISAKAQHAEAGKPGLFKLTNDPRVTSIGRVLRMTSLDELPQFWNVLRGEMSLVGPRPPLPYELEQYKSWHYRRVLEAKPGITGPWQVSGRSRTTFDEMVRLDLRYAKTYSLWNDIRILLATPAAVFSGKGAC